MEAAVQTPGRVENRGEERMADGDLMAEAREAATRARAPYSHFPVGAAVRTEEGDIVLGCNVESASYGLTLCAERVAIFASIAQGKHPMELAVTCPKGDPSVPGSLTPCGACRQVMLDQLGPDAEVHIDQVGTFTVAELMPHGFRLP
jgi:cytidine deaminase